MVKVLYIAGWGRSGSTILDNVIGAYGPVFTAGELYYLWRRGLVQRRRCGCGVAVADCPLWGKVLDAAYGTNPPDPRGTSELQRRVTKVRDTWKLLRDTVDEEAVAYRDLLAPLYRAIAEVTGAELVVDSSKMPSAAAILARVGELPGVDIEPYLLHIVRDPRAVAYSWARRKRQPDRAKPTMMTRHSTAGSTRNWLAWNSLTELVGSRAFAGRFRRVRYEDFVAAPQQTVERVFDFVEVFPAGSPFTDPHTVDLPKNHTVSGNPSRFWTGPVELRADSEWRRALPRADRLLCTAMSAPLLRRYGYRLRT